MRQSGQPGRRNWPIALIVSVLLHGLALLGLWQVSTSQPTARPDCVRMEVCSFEQQDEPGGVFVPGAGDKNLEPVRAEPKQPGIDLSLVGPGVGTLANPFHDPGEPGSGGPGQGHAVDNGTGTGGTSFFAVPAQGRRIAFVIDSSGSMGKNGALATARSELVRSLKALPADARFQVIVYSDAARFLLPARPGWLEPSSAIVWEATQALGQVPAEGATDHAQGLKAGLSLQPDVLFFLTDADDLTPEHLRLALSLNPNNRTVIYAIELNLRHRDRPDMPMQTLARLTRGRYHAVDLAEPRP